MHDGQLEQLLDEDWNLYGDSMARVEAWQTRADVRAQYEDDIDYGDVFCPECGEGMWFIYDPQELGDYAKQRADVMARHQCLMGYIVCLGCEESISFVLASGVARRQLEDEALREHTCVDVQDEGEEPYEEFDDPYVAMAYEFAPEYMLDWE